MNRTVLVALAFLAACDEAPVEVPQDAVTLSWQQGDQFHVASTYRAVANRTEETAVPLEGAIITGTHDANWSQEVVWTYQTIEADTVPESSDELFQFAQKADGSVAPITVLRAYLDKSLNTDPELNEADPIVYMVFHADRDRLAAIISFSNVNGQRVEQSWSSKQLGTSYSALSQSQLTAAPTYLAPFSAGYRDEVKTLENGSKLDSRLVDDGIVDVTYDDEMGGGLVVSRYELNQPWPTYTESDAVISRLLSPAEVNERRVGYLLPDPPEDYDFRAALAATIDLDSALILDEETMSGGWEGGAPDGYRPWAGSWWPQSKGELVYSQHGWGDDRTISSAGYELLHPLKSELDGLSDDLRDLDKGSDDYNTKLEEYRTKQGVFVDKLVEFYNGIQTDLNGGAIVIADGTISHEDDGWSYELDNLSPMDKYALQMWADGGANNNPFFAPAWELLNHWSPGARDGGWWGHCNGWAAAAILTDEPRESKTTTVKGQEMVWTPGDIKGLITETHYSQYSSFYGSRYGDEEDDISDLSPKHFHQIITFYLRDQQVPLVFDTTADAPVWNYPAYYVDLSVTETTPGGTESLVNINIATLDELDELPGIGPALGGRIIQFRELNGPFQDKGDIVSVRGIGAGTLAGFEDTITVDISSGERTFDMSARVTFSTDGVDEEHLDSSTLEPKGFINTYDYTITTDKDGRVISGTWDDEREHPDFAWVPYSNPAGYPRSGSENGYIAYSEVQRILGNYDRQ